MLRWKAFLDADEDNVTALTDLGSTEHPMCYCWDRETGLSAVQAQNTYHKCQGFEMASLPKESGTVRETAANPGFTKGVNIAGTSSVHGMAQ